MSPQQTLKFLNRDVRAGMQAVAYYAEKKDGDYKKFLGTMRLIHGAMLAFISHDDLVIITREYEDGSYSYKIVEKNLEYHTISFIRDSDLKFAKVENDTLVFKLRYLEE